MRYRVDVAGEPLEVEVEDGPDGTTLRVGAEGAATPVRLVSSPAPLFSLERGDDRAVVAVEPDPDEPGRYRVALEGRPAIEVRATDARLAHVAAASGVGRRLTKVKSPMPGVVVEVRVEPGQEVTKGEVLLILEAMKMQNEIRAEGDGRVKAVKAPAGTAVGAGAALIEFE